MSKCKAITSKQEEAKKGFDSPTGYGPTAPSSGIEGTTVEKSHHHLRNLDTWSSRNQTRGFDHKAICVMYAWITTTDVY